MNYKAFFEGKKITQLGLGLLGRGVADAVFMAECGAELLITDKKSASELEPSLKKLDGFKNITFVLGEHRLDDFKNRDLILKAAGTPIDSPYIEFAKRNHIPVEMDASLFARLAPDGVTIVGITGTRGKSTTTVLIYEILKAAGKNVYLAGNIKDKATLPLLKDVKSGDYVVLELDSWQLQGFGDAGISPNVGVFTTFYPDHMNYYRGDMDRYFFDKANIFSNQKTDDVLVVGEQAQGVRKFPERAIVARPSDVPKLWKIKLVGEHNLLNVACAIKAARALKIEVPVIKKAVEDFSPIEGRLQLLREYKGIKIYNDNNSTTPEATVAALKALGKRGDKGVILIMGGSDKSLDMSALLELIPLYCKTIILLPGTGTDQVKSALKLEPVLDLKEAIENALLVAERGDSILFSPAFASFGLFKNEYDRGAQYIKLINLL